MIIMVMLIALYVIPLLIVPIFFNKSIPSLFELSGYTFECTEELTISFFYSPVCGLLLSIICLIIYSKKFFENSIIFNKIILMSIFFIVNIKLGIPSMKIIFYINYNKNILINDIINNIELSLLKISVIALGFGICLFIKNKDTYFRI